MPTMPWFRRAEKIAKTLKSKFRKLIFNALSRSGTQNEFEKKAKNIKKLINQSVRIKRNDNVTTIATTSISELSFSFQKGTWIKLKKKIMDYLTKTKKN
jgi:predicted secreted protein